MTVKALLKRVMATRTVAVSGVLASLCVCWSTILALAAPASSFNLPDGRVYELVTSADGPLADVYAPLAITFFRAGNGDTSTKLPFQVAVDGEAIVYVGDATVGGIGNGGDAGGNEYLATRGSEGRWSQTTIQPTGRLDAYFAAFSPDLSVGILQSGDYESPEEMPLSDEAPGEGYPDLYLYALPESGDYRPLFTIRPVEPASEFTAYDLPENSSGTRSLLAYAGASENLGALLFEVHGALTPSAVDGSQENNLYVSVSGRLSPVNVLPDGAAQPNATFGAPALSEPSVNPPDFSHVISSDGSRIFWSSLESIFNRFGEVVEQRPKALYVRENPGQRQSPLGPGGECTVPDDACTVQVDATVAGAPGSSGDGRFWTASSDGSKVFFTDEHQLTEGSTAAVEAPDLYAYEVGAAGAGHLVDLTADPGGERADVQGVLGASEDGSYVYFVAQGVLAGNENSDGATAQPGGDNLYLLSPGSEPRFIATLSSVDDTHTIVPEGFYGQFGDWQPGIGHRTAEVTPSGRSVVFESDNPMDEHSPKVGENKLEEVYVYEAEDNRLVCASCESGREAPLENGESELGLGAFLPPSWSYTYLPQWISENGSRVFFDGTEPLVAQDTNNTQDVYEWERYEPNGTDGCDKSEGCVALLSDGVSKAASWFAGASANGNDAFIITRAQLTPEDGDQAYNLFDVRVGGVQPVTAPACVGTGCQGIPATPPVFATPASTTFEGVGDFPPPAKAGEKPKSPKKPKAKKPKKKSRKSKKKKKSAKDSRRVAGASTRVRESGKGRRGR